MQFIEGRSLAEVIARAAPARRPGPRPTARAAGFADGLDHDPGRRGWSPAAPRRPGATGDSSPPQVRPASGTAALDRRRPASGRGAPIRGSSTRSRGYFRTVAQLGVQAAEALDHAHSPRHPPPRHQAGATCCSTPRASSGSPTSAWPRSRATTGLTLTGDLLGTLRYMSPEQALGQAGGDRRPDRHLLAGRDALRAADAASRPSTASDRAEILRQIAEEEPTPLRRLNPAVPGDLETIVLKAMAKEPAGRLRDGAGAGRRPAAVPGGPADPGPAAERCWTGRPSGRGGTRRRSPRRRCSRCWPW